MKASYKLNSKKYFKQNSENVIYVIYEFFC
jgi:hypothetical protein